MPWDRGGDTLAVMSAAYSSQHPPCLAEQGLCCFWCSRTMDGFAVTSKIAIHGGSVDVQLGCVALLDTGSPQTFINTHAVESMKCAGAASAICKRRTPPRSWEGVGNLRLPRPPLQYV